tara:strand:+ start:99 stop:467 length:369 start_codon:yes stop_codon:yes gene_type:complete
MTAKRKEETCEDQLRRMCKRIADDITEKALTRYNGWETKHDEDDEGTLATRFMDHVYDIRYLVGSDKEYLGAKLMVAGGGPTIWVNTWTKEVEGSWGADRCTHYFIDNIGLDDYNEEMYNCI